jgi:predicted transcriptional regulator
MDPPRVIPEFQRDVVSVSTGSSVSEVVTIAYRHSFSQLPVLDSGSLIAVVTTNSVVRWLGANVTEDIFSLQESTVEDVLKHAEFPDNFELVSRDCDVFKVLDLFRSHDEEGRRLDAILITNSGKTSEKMLGIISPWDLPRLHSVVALA